MKAYFKGFAVALIGVAIASCLIFYWPTFFLGGVPK